jgi:hypothetical protein
MTEPQGTKRARTNTMGDTRSNSLGSEASTPQEQTEDASELIQQLGASEISQLLTQAAQAHPDVMSMLTNAVQAIRERERNRVISFDHYSKSIWREINVAYKSMRGGAQYDKSFEVANDTLETIETIKERCGPNVSPGTRLNGLSVLRKIGKKIAVSCGDVIAHEVQKQFQGNPALENAMYHILESMQEPEVQSIKDGTDPENLYVKLEELHELGESYSIFETMEDVLNFIADPEGEYAEDYEGDEDEDEDGGHEGDADIECISVSS